MAEVVLDANVIVASLDDADVLAARARELRTRLGQRGDSLVVLDVMLAEALSVLARRARERRTSPPDLARVLGAARDRVKRGEIVFVTSRIPELFDAVLDVMGETAGALNFNDALLAVLQREGFIDVVAPFDEGFDALPDFRRLW